MYYALHLEGAAPNVEFYNAVAHAFSGNPRELAENAEFRSYLLAMGAVGALLSGLLFLGVGLERALRQGLFQAVAIVTTGDASMDFNTWDASAKTVLLLAMFLGGSAGSAAGSTKIVRWYLISKFISRELFTTVHPEAVRPFRMADEDTL